MKGLQMDPRFRKIMRPEAQALADGMRLLNEPGIEFGNEFGYEYKHWTPMWIPFIQYSTDVWVADDNGLLPASVLIPPGQSKSFQMLTPKDHPFLLLDVKVSAAYFIDDNESGAVNYSRFNSPFNINSQTALYQKFLYPDVETLSTTLTATSNGGRPVWGSMVNTTGYDNGLKTVGNTPHTERIPLYSSQSGFSGRGSLRSYLLFATDGMIRVEVENSGGLRNLNSNSEGYLVNGVCFGYVIMR